MILTCCCQVPNWASVFLCEVKTHSHTLERSHCFAVGLNGALHCGCVLNETEDVVYSPTEAAESKPKEEPLLVVCMEEKEWPLLQNLHEVPLGGGGQSRTMLAGRNAVCSVMIKGSVCQCTALHRKAQCTGLIAPLLAHFSPRLKPHHTPGGKEKEGLKYLRGLGMWGNDIRHGPIEENLPVTFKVSSPLPVNHRKRSHLYLRFGCEWGTWECSLLRDMIQMFRQQVSYTTRPSRGASSTRRQRRTPPPPGGTQTCGQTFARGMLARASPTSHSEKDNRESTTHGANCVSAGARRC